MQGLCKFNIKTGGAGVARHFSNEWSQDFWHQPTEHWASNTNMTHKHVIAYTRTVLCVTTEPSILNLIRIRLDRPIHWGCQRVESDLDTLHSSALLCTTPCVSLVIIACALRWLHSSDSHVLWCFRWLYFSEFQVLWCFPGYHLSDSQVLWCIAGYTPTIPGCSGTH